MGVDERFRPRDRLRRRAEFDNVFASGTASSDSLLTVYVVGNGLAWSRLGIVTGKKVGNAPRRNLVRRRLREAFRKNRSALPVGFDIVCVARAAAGAHGAPVADSVTRLATLAARRSTKRVY